MNLASWLPFLLISSSNHLDAFLDVMYPKLRSIDETISPLLGETFFTETYDMFYITFPFLGRTDAPVSRYFDSGFHCISNEDHAILCLQDKNKVAVTYEQQVNDASKSELYDTKINLECKPGTSPSEVENDYFSLFKPNDTERQVLKVESCPFPVNSSLASLFSKSGRNVPSYLNAATVTNSHIRYLLISCKKMRNFTVASRNLKGLDRLRYLEISCDALEELPDDLLRAAVPDIEMVRIRDSGLKFLPEGLFRDLEKLKVVYLYNNRIEAVADDAFKGSPSLRILRFDSNLLNSFLEYSSIGPTEGIMQLNVYNNRLRRLPKGLDAIETLNFAHNSLSKVEAEDCLAFSKMRLLDLSYNDIKSIDPKCFSSMPELIYLDISGNALWRLTEEPIPTLKRLLYFFFNDNANEGFRVGKFFTSQSLISYQMRNSNVISLEDDAFSGFPHLISVDLSLNRISSVPSLLFSDNRYMRFVNLRGNEISKISPKSFGNNALMLSLDLSSNSLESFPRRGFENQVNESTLTSLWVDLLFNYHALSTTTDRLKNDLKSYGNPGLKLKLLMKKLTRFKPMEIMAFTSPISFLNMSSNKIRTLSNSTFMKLINLENVDFSFNALSELPSDIFQPLKRRYIKEVRLHGNRLSSLPLLELNALEYLDLSVNRLESIPNGKFLSLPNLRSLNVSGNKLEDLPNVALVGPNQPLHTLDLSNNMLRGIPNETLRYAKSLKRLNLSHNRISHVCFLEHLFALKLEHLNLSGNSISSISCNFDLRSEGSNNYERNRFLESLRVLDLSDNGLSLEDGDGEIDFESLTWGHLSPFRFFRNLEVLLLSNNLIEKLFLDWRVYMPKLRHVDLRRNRVKYITYQDMLFSGLSNYEKRGFGPYHCRHSITLDLRYNQIRGIEIPPKMLETLPKKNESEGFYGHAVLMIDGNPYECGCQTFNLLKVLDYDAALRSDLHQSKGEGWILPAKLEVGNLSCNVPESVRGKKIVSIEEWIHHLFPMFGFCSLAYLPLE